VLRDKPFELSGAGVLLRCCIWNRFRENVSSLRVLPSKLSV
jgi:hypothetical protein